MEKPDSLEYLPILPEAKLDVLIFHQSLLKHFKFSLKEWRREALPPYRAVDSIDCFKRYLVISDLAVRLYDLH